MAFAADQPVEYVDDAAISAKLYSVGAAETSPKASKGRSNMTTAGMDRNREIRTFAPRVRVAPPHRVLAGATEGLDVRTGGNVSGFLEAARLSPGQSALIPRVTNRPSGRFRGGRARLEDFHARLKTAFDSALPS
jgi:hypothetical protein